MLCVGGICAHAALSGKLLSSPGKTSCLLLCIFSPQWRFDESLLREVYCGLDVLRLIPQNDKVWAVIQEHIPSLSYSLQAGSRRRAVGYLIFWARPCLGASMYSFIQIPTRSLWGRYSECFHLPDGQMEAQRVEAACPKDQSQDSYSGSLAPRLLTTMLGYILK